jgi:hypothetical protein
VTAALRVLYIFVAMEIGSRRILHVNVTSHPTTECTTQQFRQFLAYDHPYRFVIHDRDAIFSKSVDQARFRSPFAQDARSNTLRKRILRTRDWDNPARMLGFRYSN